MLDKVVLHEIAHAVTMGYGLLEGLRKQLPERYWIAVEEWSAQLVERYGAEALEIASETLGRPVCVRGFCHD